MKDKKMIGRGQVITCVVFLLVIFGGTMLTLLSKPRQYSERERRYLQMRPELTKESLYSGEFAVKYEEYLTDQFVGRDTFIMLKTSLERMVGRQDNNGIYFGKDGYLIEKIEEKDIDPEQWEKNKQWIVQFLGKYESILGEDHVRALLAPTSNYVLQDKLPPFASAYNQEMINQTIEKDLSEKVSEETAKSLLVDVNQTLRDKSGEYIYYRTDHHWTSLGAYYAYVQWAKSVGLQPKEQSEYEQIVGTSDFYGTFYNKVGVAEIKDKITLFDDKETYQVTINMGEKVMDSLFDYGQLTGDDPYSVFLGGNNAFVEITSSQTNGKRLLVVKDSYAHTLVPLLAHHFEEVVLVDLRYLNMKLEDLVEQYEITDLLLLYNDSTVMSDKNLVKLVK
ncbi:DHHW family protein [Anaerosporobacter faecicola]|uniref:DHHW family protein n=1 Tax=Anaerosporobacter faecicola TaxID=2718714 RepID=UPI00143A08C2|nr:DHHW family protein [Anaerosporobacter faecicola]